MVVDEVIGDVGDRKVIIVDEEISTGGTVVAAATSLVAHGAREVYCAATHGVLCGEAPLLMEQSPIIETAVTNSLPISDEKLGSKTRIISIASMLGEAIYRIHRGLSVGEMFEGATRVQAVSL